MAVNAVRAITINFTGDVIGDKIYEAVENTASPGSITLHELTTGSNTITVPVSTGVSVKGVTFIPPSGNTAALTLKGVDGDTGIAIGKTDPTSLAFDTSPPASIVINAGAAVSGFRAIWT